jgi:organic radical activating enzyme
VNLVEIFSSAQGEGPYVGTLTLFLRFAECDLRCAWCDSPHTWKPARSCRIETERGSGRFRSVPSPLRIGDALAAAEALGAKQHRFVSLTGGEPLLQPEAVRELAGELRRLGPGILLETHGLAVSALGRVLDRIDVVSMDWKLASDVRRAEDPKQGAAVPFHAEHERFLRLATQASQVVIKVVITEATEDEEVREACARIARVAPDSPLILQPVTPFGSVRSRPSAQRLLRLAAAASQRLRDVRIIPQTHATYGAP